MESQEIHVGEAFDLQAVPKLLQAADGAAVVIGFSSARVISDAAVAALVEGLRARSPRSRARGLRRHHRVLLQYMGLLEMVAA